MPIRVLILLVLVSPFFSALLLRYLRTRLTAAPFYSIGTVLFGVAAAALVLLAQTEVERFQVGSILLIQPQGVDLALPVPQAPPTPTARPVQVGATPTMRPAQPTATLTPTLTPPTATTTLTPTATVRPTASPAASAPSTPTPTSVPATDTPRPQAALRRYTVQNGDTLRSIAEDFGVTVQQIMNANDFSAADADSIQPGDTLLIP